MPLLCQLCGAPACVPCLTGCGAVFFCSQAHAAEAQHDGETCARLRAQVGAKQTLYSATSHAWAASACSSVDAGASTCDVLRHFGVHNVGVWRRECECALSVPFGLLFPRGLPADADAHAAAWALSGELCPPFPGGGGAFADEAVAAAIASWCAFYASARLPLHSPAALCLDTPLTLVASLLRHGLPFGNVARVHLVGPRKELDQLPAFLQAARLLPGAAQLVLLFIGPDVPPQLHATAVSSADGRLHCAFRATACYEPNAAPDLRSIRTPHLVFAPNAGVPAYPQLWRRTCASLSAASQPVRLVITDYTEEAAVQTQFALHVQGLTCVSGPEVNPLRRPVCHPGSGTALPAFSNGWTLCFAAGGARQTGPDTE